MKHLKQIKRSQLLAAFLCTSLAPALVTAAVVHNQDTIVQGSLCTGFDCSSGESFGFDTLRLKENNLRINFNDTSTSASFPSNDWRITINDSSNGGANYFGVEDSTAGRIPFRIEAGAPVHTLYVEADGDVGIKTSNPVVDLHIVEGNTPTVRLEQDGSDGFTPQTWDLAGNETNFFIRDVTNGSKLSFRIKPGAPTDSLFVAADGDIGLGTDSPGSALHVRGTGSKQFRLESTDNNGIQLRLISGVADNRRILARNDGDSATFTQIQMADSRIEFAGANATSDLWLTIDATGITTTSGGACTATPCDAVFNPEEYQVESIQEHAAYMWENQYLWGVGPTKKGESINLTKKTTGILHELEKAHIYIEQLHNNVQQLEARLAKVQLLEARLAKLENNL